MTNFMKVAELSEIKEGELTSVEVDNELICLVKVNGDICAFSDNCTHVSGPLSEGELEGEIVTCPWHGAQFNVHTGKVLCGPALQDIPTYPVQVEGESVLISLPEE